MAVVVELIASSLLKFNFLGAMKYLNSVYFKSFSIPSRSALNVAMCFSIEPNIANTALANKKISSEEFHVSKEQTTILKWNNLAMRAML